MAEWQVRNLTFVLSSLVSYRYKHLQKVHFHLFLLFIEISVYSTSWIYKCKTGRSSNMLNTAYWPSQDKKYHWPYTIKIKSINTIMKVEDSNALYKNVDIFTFNNWRLNTISEVICNISFGNEVHHKWFVYKKSLPHRTTNYEVR